MIGLWPFKPRRSGKAEVMLGECPVYFQREFEFFGLWSNSSKLESNCKIGQRSLQDFIISRFNSFRIIECLDFTKFAELYS